MNRAQHAYLAGGQCTFSCSSDVFMFVSVRCIFLKKTGHLAVFSAHIYYCHPHNTMG